MADNQNFLFIINEKAQSDSYAAIQIYRLQIYRREGFPLTGIGVTQICNYAMRDNGDSCSKRGGNFGGVLILAAIMSKFAAYLLHVTICVRKK